MLNNRDLDSKEIDLLLETVAEIPPEIRLGKWYFGGVASALAACLTHPLDLLKVHLQTAKSSNELHLLKNTISIINHQGYSALYNGLSASLLRQLTYSTTRFGLYEVLKQSVSSDSSMNPPFYQKVLMAAVSGAAGGFVVGSRAYSMKYFYFLL